MSVASHHPSAKVLSPPQASKILFVRLQTSPPPAHDTPCCSGFSHMVFELEVPLDLGLPLHLEGLPSTKTRTPNADVRRTFPHSPFCLSLTSRDVLSGGGREESGFSRAIALEAIKSLSTSVSKESNLVCKSSHIKWVLIQI